MIYSLVPILVKGKLRILFCKKGGSSDQAHFLLSCVHPRPRGVFTPTWLLRHVHLGHIDAHVVPPVRKVLPHRLQLLARRTPRGVAAGRQQTTRADINLPTGWAKAPEAQRRICCPSWTLQSFFTVMMKTQTVRKSLAPSVSGTLTIQSSTLPPGFCPSSRPSPPSNCPVCSKQATPPPIAQKRRAKARVRASDRRRTSCC